MRIIKKKLNDLTLHITDGEHGSVTNEENGEYFLLSNKNIVDGEIIITEEDRTISKESFLQINKRTKLEAGDIVLSTVGTIGKSALIKTEDLKFDFQRSVGIIKCDPEALSPLYLLYYFNLSFVQKRLKRLSKGGVQKCLFISDLKNLDVHLPENINDQIESIKKIEIIEQKIDNNLKANQELRQLANHLYNGTFFNKLNEFPKDEMFTQ